MRSSRLPWAVYAITRHGVSVATRLLGEIPDADLYVSEKVAAGAPACARPFPLPMGPLLAETFPGYDCHVFVVSVGAVVRLVASLLRDKKEDPAVVCVDEMARFSICVLSGHVGRGNAFTERVARALGAQPVVTTASDALGTLTVDILGRDLGWTLDDPDRNVTRGCAAVVNGAPVLFVQESGEPSWWPEARPFPPGVAYATALDGVDPAAWEVLLVATDRDFCETHPGLWEKAVVYRPRSLVLGIGCDRGIPPDLVERGVRALLAESRLSSRSVRTLATVDLKKGEPALLALSERLGAPLQTYPAEQLDAVAGIENPSEVVKRHVGTRGVAEPAALLAAGAERLLAPKRTYTEPGAGRSMTLAVARVPFPPRRGESRDG
ncbi:MAG: cobalamin biosynthesis protein [Planctomycetales bacterium]|nr:cobalamin biosynthesis protein [Planctomycetales bacterium]